MKATTQNPTNWVRLTASHTLTFSPMHGLDQPANSVQRRAARGHPALVGVQHPQGVRYEATMNHRWKWPVLVV